MAIKAGRVGIHPSQVDPITGMLLSGPSGSTNYNDLSNKPQINGVTLSGNKTTSDLHIEGASDLADLDDVTISTPEAGQLLVYDGDKWENQFASISPVTPATLASLQDVRIDTPEVGQQLIYDGNKWENQFASISPLSLAQLRDVVITDLQDGDFITYDSTSEKWVNTGEAPGPVVIHKEITIYSAVEDVISYTDIYGATQTEAFAANSDHKTITVDIYESGSNITFTSSVAKNPDSLSDAYSKTVIITNATSDVYVMPDNALYWWGYESSDIEDNGMGNSSCTSQALTRNKNNIQVNYSGSNACSCLNTKNQISGTVNLLAKRTSTYNGYGVNATKDMGNEIIDNQLTTTMAKHTVSASSQYFYFGYWNLANRSVDETLYALWYE